MAREDARRKLDEKREEMRRKGKPDYVGKPRETDRDLIEEGDRKRSGTNLDIDEERSEEQQREMDRWRRE